ncbi:hypothetical protein H3143_01455 [Mycoplasma tullyi]|uniref:Uncharacterized protein n=1 Tax=Mycoplasma tullyi TaxID=1612150 RepID=A0A7D7YM84_9MOLU|nr:hypothetical protein [Mycoplasma tullyi]QMT98782.1 hypothetical protein H3143_01455 [Mycoplasma tullyi]
MAVFLILSKAKNSKISYMKVIWKTRNNIEIETTSFDEKGKRILAHSQGHNLRPLVIWYDKSNVYYLNCRSGEGVNADGTPRTKPLLPHNVEFIYNGKLNYVNVSNIQVMNRYDFEKIYGALDSNDLKLNPYDLPNYIAKQILEKMNDFIEKGDYTVQKVWIENTKELKNGRNNVWLGNKALYSKEAGIYNDFIDERFKLTWETIMNNFKKDPPGFWENKNCNFKDSSASKILTISLSTLFNDYEKYKQRLKKEEKEKKNKNDDYGFEM